MRVITEIGEQGVTLPSGRSMRFRPSLYAMTQIGSPREIVEVFTALHEPPIFGESMPWDCDFLKQQMQKINARRARDHWRHMLFLSWQVMYACAESDPKEFIGEPGEKYASYRMGAIEPEIMLVMARSLLHHGLIGPRQNVPQSDGKDAEPAAERRGAQEFDAMAFVSKAVAHLGVSEDEAWNMTLTSFGSHWAAKFGEHKEKRHSDEHDQTMRWLKEVNKARASRV